MLVFQEFGIFWPRIGYFLKKNWVIFGNNCVLLITIGYFLQELGVFGKNWVFYAKNLVFFGMKLFFFRFSRIGFFYKN